MSVSRLQEVDALRAFALAGIAFVNLPFLALPPEAIFAVPETLPDLAAAAAVEILLAGKIFVLFSFLFGWGMGTQIAAAERRGVAARGPFLRRLAGLAGLGVAHALLVFHGDILVLYAILGLGLWLVRDLSTTGLLRVAGAAALLAPPAYALLGLGLADGAMLPPEGATTGYLGTYWDAVAQRARDWPASLAFVLLFNGPLAFAAFCLGLAAERTGFLDPGSAGFAALERRVPWLLALGLGANLGYGAAVLAIWGGVGGSALPALGFALLALGSPALGAVYLWAVIRAARAGLVPAWFAAAGRMSASVYVAEGIAAGLVFHGHGLGLYGQLGPAALLFVAAAIVAGLHAAAALWDRWLGAGPLERLLRRLAWGARPRPGVPSPPSAPSASRAR